MKDAGANKFSVWDGYSSLLLTIQLMARFAALPLLPELAHDLSTLLTVGKKAIYMTKLAVGEKPVTLRTFDISRPDLEKNKLLD